MATVTLMTRNLGSIASAFDREYSHEIGLAVLAKQDGSGYAYAVVDVETGDVTAWDGWYYGTMPESSALGPLVEMNEWTDRDTSLTQAVLGRSLAWLPIFGTAWMPAFSLGDLACRVIRSHGRDGTDDMGSGWHVASYYPLDLTRTAADNAAGSN
ncbi:hypothetical protein ACRTEC_07970 [Janibacter indicus]